jgi:NosR/NirI family nitrous oxide reductase transcriptional regulator
MYKYLVIIILLIAVAISGGRDYIFADKDKELIITLEDVEPLFLDATDIETNKQGTIEVWQGIEKIGQCLLSTKYIDKNYGYAGIVPVLIGINNDNKVVGISILENRETKDYLWYIYQADFLQKWNGLSSKEASLLEVDAVSRATETSEAIIKAVKASTSVYSGAGTYAENKDPIFSNMKDILFLFVIVLSVVFAYSKSAKKYRFAYLVIIVITMGIILNKSLSLGILHNWVVKEIPWQASWQVILLFLITVIISFFGKPKFYCSYLCPMGALQELINKISPLKKKRMPKIANKIKLKETYFILMVAALLLGFLPNLYHFEPFLFFSFQVIGYGIIIFGISIIILSLFFVKPWCAMCPTGACLDIITLKRKKDETNMKFNLRYSTNKHD